VGGLGPNWLIPDPTGIESVFIDFKEQQGRHLSIAKKIEGFGGRPLLVGGLGPGPLGPSPKSGPDIT